MEGWLPPEPEDRAVFTQAELALGWRLACRARAQTNLTLELAQWEAPILSDDSVFEFTAQPGWGIALDLGTTTIVAQLLNLQNGHVAAVRTALNAQARFGADIMSRVQLALTPSGQEQLQRVVRRQIGQMISELLSAAGFDAQGSVENRQNMRKLELVKIVLVGNTVMHHLFCGLSVEPLSHSPFESTSAGLQSFSASELGWDIPGDPAVSFLPCLGGFVGSDVLAGVLATRLHESECLSALMDLGTNGEIVLGNRDRLLCASTAAGPAFEGARISKGMRAATGAISRVRVTGGRLHSDVLGSGPARGICGSGLLDAVAAGLDLGWILPSGRLSRPEALELAPLVTLTQGDIRELQLAKGAIAAGLKILLQRWGAAPEELHRIYLAGAFGNYINYASARRIGLLPFPEGKVQPAGNTALLGAKLALFRPPGQDRDYAELRARTTHVPLNEDPQFQEVFVGELAYPAAGAEQITPIK